MPLVLAAFIFSCDGGNSEKEVSETLERSIPVEALVINPQSVVQNISLTGVLNPLSSVDLVAEVSGKVTKVNKKLGDFVTTKDILATIDDNIPLNNYEQSKAQLSSAEANLKIAQLNLKSDRQLFQNGDISELAFENSQLAVKTADANQRSASANLSLMKKTYNDTRIKSPISGLISRKTINLGTMVTPNMMVYRVVNLNTLKIEVGIAQEIIGRVKQGNTAEITISGLNRQKFTGVVRHISPQADEKTGAFMTEIHVQNTPDKKIKAGMTARIALTLMTKEKQIVLSDNVVMVRDGAEYVYRISGQRAKLSKIDIGESFGSQVSVDNGLSAGDTVVIVGMKNLGVDTQVLIEELHESL
jgi:membrane fusion protein (multidrug efflux system)